MSRVHVKVAFESGQWWVRDLGSTNGSYVDDSRIQRVRLDKELRLQLARDGPVLCLTVEIRVAVPDTDVTVKSSHPEGSMEHYVRHYIFSAAVIGRDPQEFGFDFDSPLAPYM